MSISHLINWLITYIFLVGNGGLNGEKVHPNQSRNFPKPDAGEGWITDDIVVRLSEDSLDTARRRHEQPTQLYSYNTKFYESLLHVGKDVLTVAEGDLNSCSFKHRLS